MKRLFTTLVSIGLVAAVGILNAGCSSTPEKIADDRRVYFPKMNDSIAMNAVFNPMLMDTTYLGAGPNAGEIAEITPRWGWIALNSDSLRERYPVAQVEGAAIHSIPVYYNLGGYSERSDAKYVVSYIGELSSNPGEEGELGSNEGRATFLKNDKGWYLADNVYNTDASKQRESAAKEKKEPANERMFTLHWSRETRVSGNSMQCATQSYKNFTFYGSNILEVPKGQIWVPVAGESKPSANSSLYTWVNIESDDERTNSPCYFGTLRKLPENLSKNVTLAKDEFHKYYGGAKIRFWGQSAYNEVTILVIGPGPIPASTEEAPGRSVAASHATNAEPKVEQGPQSSQVAATAAETGTVSSVLFGLFGERDVAKNFTGNVGNLKTHYSLKLVDNQIITGTYYYDKNPDKKYTLKGKFNEEDDSVTLTEYTGDTESATCKLTLAGNCYTGRMQNTDGRSFNMTACR